MRYHSNPSSRGYPAAYRAAAKPHVRGGFQLPEPANDNTPRRNPRPANDNDPRYRTPKPANDNFKGRTAPSGAKRGWIRPAAGIPRLDPRSWLWGQIADNLGIALGPNVNWIPPAMLDYNNIAAGGWKLDFACPVGWTTGYRLSGGSPSGCLTLQAVTPKTNFGVNDAHMTEWVYTLAPPWTGNRFRVLRNWSRPTPNTQWEYKAGRYPVSYAPYAPPLAAIDPFQQPVSGQARDPNVRVRYRRLPHRRPNINRSPSEQSQWGYGYPETEVEVIPKQTVVTTSPGQSPTIGKKPNDHQFRPPPRGVKENKMAVRNKTVVRVLERVLGAVTEAADIIDVLWKALPTQLTEDLMKRNDYYIPRWKKAQYVYRYNHLIDPAKFLDGMFEMEIEDWMWAEWSEFTRLTFKQYYEQLKLPFGFETGGNLPWNGPAGI